MIDYVLNKMIDKNKYDTCVANSIQSKIYAFSWYLDAVTETWDVLILGDYEAVMPLPKRKKYGINYVFQPYWIQHLGVFSKNVLPADELKLFLSRIPKKIKFINYNINFKAKATKARINYILPLQVDYNELFSNFSKLRKRSILKAQKAGLVLKTIVEWEPVLNLSKQKLQQDFKISFAASLKLEKLFNKAKQLNKLKILAAYSKNDALVGGAFFMVSYNRITYLFSVINKEGRELQAMSFILDTIIKEYASTKFVLDFEGSMLPGIARFIKSFNPQKEVYYQLKKWRLF